MFAISVPRILNQYVYYAGSSFASGGVQAALDTIKILAREDGTTQTLGFSNIVNYTRGINGLVFDTDLLASTSLSTADFIFQWSPQGGFDATASANQPINWATASVSPTVIDVSSLGGNSNRIRLEWANNAIQNRWLRVTIKANASTGLPADNVFYIGHLMGEVTGLQSGNASTQPYQRFTINNLGDVALIRANLNSPALVTNIYDLNKNGTVQNLGDVTSARAALGNQLTNIQIPGGNLRDRYSGRDWDEKNDQTRSARLLGRLPGSGLIGFYLPDDRKFSVARRWPDRESSEPVTVDVHSIARRELLAVDKRQFERFPVQDQFDNENARSKKRAASWRDQLFSREVEVTELANRFAMPNPPDNLWL
jgi:hypothetical protein